MSKRRPGAPADLEELRPNYFVVHNPLVGVVLRGEGERDGDRFILTSWRREGLLARLRARQFKVLTLADQIAALPELPAVAPLGPTITRPLASGERISLFAGPDGWQPAPPAPDTPDAVLLRHGQLIRRRKGRGPGDYYLVATGTLQPLAEDKALLVGYARIAHDGRRTLTLTPPAQGLRLPDLPLPAAHRTLLGRLAEPSRDGWHLPPESVELVSALLARLGLVLHYQKPDSR
jgi:hypothetical protein